EMLVDEHINSFNTPFKFNGKEYDEETGNYYYGARYYDPKWSIFIGVDPLAEKYSDWSSYAYCFNNPIIFVDPDGKDGVKIIDNKNKTITIKATYFVQTEEQLIKGGKTISGYSCNDIEKMYEINTQLNDQELVISEGEYEGYSLKFDLTFEDGGSSVEAMGKANFETFEGYDIGNTIGRNSPEGLPTLFGVKEGENDRLTQIGGVTDANKYITMNRDSDTRKNKRHEIGHTLGLDDNHVSGAKKGIMNYPPKKSMSQFEANKLANSDFLPAIIKTE
ncbi:RHS repeat-associated core domain-containing protein, partial [Flavobacterium sp. ST-75]